MNNDATEHLPWEGLQGCANPERLNAALNQGQALRHCVTTRSSRRKYRHNTLISLQL